MKPIYFLLGNIDYEGQTPLGFFDSIDKMKECAARESKYYDNIGYVELKSMNSLIDFYDDVTWFD